MRIAKVESRHLDNLPPLSEARQIPQRDFRLFRFGSLAEALNA